MCGVGGGLHGVGARVVSGQRAEDSDAGMAARGHTVQSVGGSQIDAGYPTVVPRIHAV